MLMPATEFQFLLNFHYFHYNSFFRCDRYLRRLVSNIVVLGLLVGSGLVIYHVANAEDVLPDTTPTFAQEFVQKYKVNSMFFSCYV